MKPDEMRKHVKEIRGLDEFPIRDHDHLIQLLGGKDKEIKFNEKKLKTDDMLRMFPANYFPVASEEDMIAKAVKLIELGREGFQAATGKRPDKESGPPAKGKEHEIRLQPHDVDGQPK